MQYITNLLNLIEHDWLQKTTDLNKFCVIRMTLAYFWASLFFSRHSAALQSGDISINLMDSEKESSWRHVLWGRIKTCRPCSNMNCKLWTNSLGHAPQTYYFILLSERTCEKKVEDKYNQARKERSRSARKSTGIYLLWRLISSLPCIEPAQATVHLLKCGEFEF